MGIRDITGRHPGLLRPTGLSMLIRGPGRRGRGAEIPRALARPSHIMSHVDAEVPDSTSFQAAALLGDNLGRGWQAASESESR